MKATKLILFLAFILFACEESKPKTKEQYKEEIRSTEKAFEKMADEKGIAEAFWFFADSNAVIKRQNDTLIHGKEGIRNYYKDDFYKNANVTWSPDFIDIDEQGSLGYTYGNYLWKAKDSSGKTEEYKGVFHTVWKKQANGDWKYVWD
jgi:ketosteroid isomerase-like protein